MTDAQAVDLIKWRNLGQPARKRIKLPDEEGGTAKTARADGANPEPRNSDGPVGATILRAKPVRVTVSMAT